MRTCRTSRLGHRRRRARAENKRSNSYRAEEDAGKVEKTEYVIPADPVLEAITATGDAYHPDGRILVIYLK